MDFIEGEQCKPQRCAQNEALCGFRGGRGHKEAGGRRAGSVERAVRLGLEG